MARRGDGIYQRSRTWWLDFRHEGKRHVARLGKGINRTVAGEIARVKALESTVELIGKFVAIAKDRSRDRLHVLDGGRT
jgi:hypothetical protein